MSLGFAALPTDEEVDAFVMRASDDRVGFWTMHYTAIGSAAAVGAMSTRNTDAAVRVIQRWRLEKADPLAALSPPVRPITYHIDPSVPERWRHAMKRGVENWNVAFETAGFTNAVKAVLPGDADWPADYAAADTRYSSISWAVSTDSTYAVGPHMYDPRTGEILDADIMFAHSWVHYWTREKAHYAASGAASSASSGAGGGRGRLPIGNGARHGGAAEGGSDVDAQLGRAQTRIFELLGEGRAASPSGNGHGATMPQAHRRPGPCGHAGHPQRSMEMALAAAAAALPPSGVDEEEWAAVSQAFLEEALIETVSHEVGHTLGLRHNFKGSHAYDYASMHDVSVTATRGIGATVMDYHPINIPSNRSLQGQYYTTAVGAYDKWAIRYGYTPVPAEVDLEQHAELAAIAAEGAADPALQFASDEDTPRSDGVDPAASTWDLSSDPVGYYTDRLALAQNLLAEAANRTVRPGESWALQTSTARGFMRSAITAGSYVAKHIGGIIFSRGHRGDVGAAPPVVPVSGAEQARALRLVLQIISHDFWLPLASAVAHMPKHIGWGCDPPSPSTDEYCMGLGQPELLSSALEVRVPRTPRVNETRDCARDQRPLSPPPPTSAHLRPSPRLIHGPPLPLLPFAPSTGTDARADGPPPAAAPREPRLAGVDGGRDAQSECGVGEPAAGAAPGPGAARRCSVAAAPCGAGGRCPR